MRGATAAVRIIRPRTLSHALRLLQEDPRLTPMAGCTDLYVQLHLGTLPKTAFLDLWPLRELAGVSRVDGAVRVGALSTWRTIGASPVIRRHLPMLAAAAHEIGAVQIQNRGTIGGNIANGSPAGDSLPVLAVAEALVELTGAGWVRKVPMTAFYTGYRTSVRRPGELITAVEIPAIDGPQWFRKVGTRAAQSISKVVMAAVRGERPRIALGAVAPTVVRVPRTEEALAAGASLDDCVVLLQGEISPIDDIRSTAAYRRRVAAQLLRQFWRETAPG